MVLYSAPGLSPCLYLSGAALARKLGRVAVGFMVDIVSNSATVRGNAKIGSSVVLQRADNEDGAYGFEGEFDGGDVLISGGVTREDRIGYPAIMRIP